MAPRYSVNSKRFRFTSYKRIVSNGAEETISDASDGDVYLRAVFSKKKYDVMPNNPASAEYKWALPESLILLRLANGNSTIIASENLNIASVMGGMVSTATFVKTYEIPQKIAVSPRRLPPRIR